MFTRMHSFDLARLAQKPVQKLALDFSRPPPLIFSRFPDFFFPPLRGALRPLAPSKEQVDPARRAGTIAKLALLQHASAKCSATCLRRVGGDICGRLELRRLGATGGMLLKRQIHVGELCDNVS